jgi:hypothetical protein
MDFQLAVGEHVRHAGGTEGAVLLDLRSGKYLALNSVGSLLWEEIAAGASRDQAVEHLAARFPEVSADRLSRDADALLGQLLARGLLRPTAGTGRERQGARTAMNPPAPAAPPAAAETPLSPAGRPEVDGVAGPHGSLRWTLAGYLGLLLSDAVLHLLGFSRFHALVRSLPTRSPRCGPARVQRIVAGVDRASAFYFKHAWCLQRSAVTVALLRLAGFPARLVIAVQRVPFRAHAWAELDGRVVNDRPAVRRELEVLETC